jgi:ferredoxin
MNVAIDSSKCEGHASCAIICGSVFELDDDGYGKVIDPNPDERLRGSVAEAVENCPEQAISLDG